MINVIKENINKYLMLVQINNIDLFIRCFHITSTWLYISKAIYITRCIMAQ